MLAMSRSATEMSEMPRYMAGSSREPLPLKRQTSTAFTQSAGISISSPGLELAMRSHTLTVSFHISTHARSECLNNSIGIWSRLSPFSFGWAMTARLNSSSVGALASTSHLGANLDFSANISSINFHVRFSFSSGGTSCVAVPSNLTKCVLQRSKSTVCKFAAPPSTLPEICLMTLCAMRI